MAQIKTIKKLIEVALPLDDINAAAAKEKSIRHGHPSTLHLWWARRPLAAARAIIFAQMVNDPGGNRGYGPGKTKAQVKIEREKLFDIIRKLVLWENTNNEDVLEEARAEIWKSWREICDQNKSHPDAAELFNPEKLPGFHDPFAGGGALPLEAQRLGLTTKASDLNPVPVLINKAMLEVPGRFLDRHPIGPIPESETQQRLPQDWPGPSGLAEDVRRYGLWLKDKVFEKVGSYYSQVDLPEEYGGGKAPVIAWLWARTVKSPNPAFANIDVPLVTNFFLGTKPGKEAYIQPIVDGDEYRFIVKTGMPENAEEVRSGTKLARGAKFKCILSGTPIGPDYIKAEGKAGRMGARLMAVAVEGKRGRIYIGATPEIEGVAIKAEPSWLPDFELSTHPQYMGTIGYGLTKFSHLFTKRQLLTLDCICGTLADVRAKIIDDMIAGGVVDDGVSLQDGGKLASAYADAVVLYLAFFLSRMIDLHNSLCQWRSDPSKEHVGHLFSRQAISMIWDFAEANPFGSSAGGWEKTLMFVPKVIEHLKSNSAFEGVAVQQDATSPETLKENAVFSSDPPYYDNVPYADLSDFFYIWLRRALRDRFPATFPTLLVPKASELVADSKRHGGKDSAEVFFMDGMSSVMKGMVKQGHPAYPVTLYYAFKQSEQKELGTGSTGWETFLEAVIRSGFAICGTWPLRTELGNRTRNVGSNALASSIVLVCQKRDANAPTVSRREFLRELKDELAEAIEEMIGGSDGISPVAPVDLAQAVIGPGMGVFSKYSAVLEADGTSMSVHVALTLINKMVTEGGDDFEPDTQFCLAWFDQYGWSSGPFGEATVLAQAKATSVDGVRDAGVIESGSGKVRLLKHIEYPTDWSPESDTRTPIWEALHQLIRAHRSGGDTVAGGLLARMHERAEPIRQLAYRLYTLCERKGWAEDARAYNELITAWPHIEAASHEAGRVGSQAKLDI